MTRIVVVDDEVAVVELVRGYLEREHDGIEVCRQLRQFSDAYVILLTARAEEIDKILGLTFGADDYLTRPFSPH